MERSLPVSLTTALILCVAVGPLVTGAQAGASPVVVPPDQQLPTQQVDTTEAGQATPNETTPVGTDGVILSVDVYENGTAGWQIEFRTRLDDRDDRAEFAHLQQKLESGSAASSGGFYDRIRETITAAEETTGREMAGENFDVRTTVRHIPREYGVVVYSFQWEGFATGTEQGLQAGDALEGFFLSSGERLVISWPDGYELDNVEPTPDAQRDGAVVWRGPTTFGSGGPQLTLTEQGWPGARAVPVALAAAVVVLAGIAWTLRGRVGVPMGSLRARLFDDGDDEAALLSNEERVVQLLDERGGRVKQQEVADELGWTEAKTSYVVSNLREEEWIRSFRVGRENVLSLADSLEGRQSES